jgi:hypothetical protein
VTCLHNARSLVICGQVTCHVQDNQLDCNGGGAESGGVGEAAIFLSFFGEMIIVLCVVVFPGGSSSVG